MPTTDLNIGTIANDHTGDTLRSGGGIINANNAILQADTAQVQSNLTAHENDTTNPHSVTKAQVGLSNVDNTSDANKPVSSATQTALDAKQSTSEKGQANGYAGLDGTGKVPSSQLPEAGLGDMVKTTYDPANISEQLVGETAVQTVSNKTFTNAKYINLDTTYIPTGTEPAGTIYWNETDRTLDLVQDGTTLQLGQELFIRARNTTGEQINNGKVVYISGRTGVFPDISLAQGNIGTTGRSIGVTTEDIANNAFGAVATFGYVRRIKTDYTGTGDWGTTWVSNDNLWLSKTVAGQLTNVEPSAPHHSDIIGEVGVLHPTEGAISINQIPHITLKELSDVNGTPLDTNGQMVVWNNDNQYFDFTANTSDFATAAQGVLADSALQTANLTSDVTGVLPQVNGGTGATTASGARDALGVQYGTTGGTVLEGSKDAEYAKKAEANTFTANQTISSTQPTLFLNETDTGQTWRTDVSGDQMRFIRSASVLGTLNSSGDLSVVGDLSQNGQTVGEPDFYKYRIVTSVTSDNLKVELKNYLGDDPSVAVPVKVQIDGIIFTIDSPDLMTVSVPAGANNFNSGSSELATKEIDYFLYLTRRTSNDAIYLMMSRIPNGTQGIDFSNTNTNEKKGWITNGLQIGPPSVSGVTNIGRFNATLSASPYNWSIPATSVILNRPVYETRWLDADLRVYGSTGSAGTYAEDNMTKKYKIVGDTIYIKHRGRVTNVGSWTGNLQTSVPFSPNSQVSFEQNIGRIQAQGGIITKSIAYQISTSGIILFTNNYAIGAYGYSGLANNDWIAIDYVYNI